MKKHEVNCKITKEQYLAMPIKEKQVLSEYCAQDCRILYQLIDHIYMIPYCNPINNSFTKNDPFYYSSAVMAFDIFGRSFLKEDILVNSKALLAERQSMLGGKTQADRSFSNVYDLIIAIDLKSAYPAAMKNLMPVVY